jgi:exodeoxyribonuclease-3
MKIITWNINGYRAVTGQNASKRYDQITKENKLFAYIEQEDPDIICLQEIKADQNQILENLLAPPGYEYIYNSARSKKGYSGTAIFSKKKANSYVCNLGDERFDGEGRIIEADFGDFAAFDIYFPKGYTDNDRLDYKLEFYDYLYAYISKKYSKDSNVIISGDYNTAHTEIDLARPKENVNTSGFLEIERKKLDQLVDMGFKDAFREKCADANKYTWWSQRGQARKNNVGWRIDYHFVSDAFVKSLVSSEQQDQTLGSDHCPVVAVFE